MRNSKSKKEENNLQENNPCWKGYEPIGMKDKDGKEVPNCVPKNKKKEQSKQNKKS